jgi:hypothetical protein
MYAARLAAVRAAAAEVLAILELPERPGRSARIGFGGHPGREVAG